MDGYFNIQVSQAYRRSIELIYRKSLDLLAGFKVEQGLTYKKRPDILAENLVDC